MTEKKPVYEKMSKSIGNVVLPEEVIYAVRSIKDGYEFRFSNGNVIKDFREFEIWQDDFNSKMFFTSTRLGKIPVFLHIKDDPEPSLLLIDGEEKVQHSIAE